MGPLPRWAASPPAPLLTSMPLWRLCPPGLGLFSTKQTCPLQLPSPEKRPPTPLQFQGQNLHSPEPLSCAHVTASP